VKNVVITRTNEGNRELSEKLRNAGLSPIPVDTISFGPPQSWSRVDRLLKRLHTFDWLAFTSATGVRYFGRRMYKLLLAVPWEGRPLVAAVGERTAAALSSLGIRPSFVPSAFLTSRLAEELSSGPGTKVLLLRADIADPGLSGRLSARGFVVDEAAVYRTLEVVGRFDGRVREADLIVFASPSEVRGFCMHLPRNDLAALTRVRAVCIGPVTAAAAKAEGFVDVVTPGSHTIDAVVEKVLRLSHEDA